MSTPIEEILSLYRDRTQIAKAAGVTRVSAVGNWLSRGSIPRKPALNMLRTCEEYNVSKYRLFVLLLSDYFAAMGSK